MNFVDLDRLFVPLRKDAEVALDWGPSWGRKYGGWLDWEDILSHWRVALLAEALSGKTEELKHRADVLKRAGKAAFFLTIEGLAEDRFEAALDDADRVAFAAWKTASSGDAWFFLDSVDEARLNGKRLTTAFQNFRSAVQASNLSRTHIIVSCRASDWRGKADRDALDRELPHLALASGQDEPKDPDEILLAPVFEKKSRTTRTESREKDSNKSELLVVQLAPMTGEQQRRLAEAAQIRDVPDFLKAVQVSGLGATAERPGDLIELIGYWLEHGRFGSLAVMTEEGVKRKLREADAYRPEAGALSPEQARWGAERLAAALTLAKTFTIKAPGQDPDPSLAKGAVDASDVLPEWSQTGVNALLRSGLFAPGTYGRIRFHHRSTQEYLAASWLRRLATNNCPVDELFGLLFARSYGVSTVVPTLRAVTAWLSLWISSVREAVIQRQPATLIVHGDPKSLPLDARERLLEAYARLDSMGDINAEYIDFRAAWMFAEPSLANAIKRAWKLNSRTEFRTALLRFVEEGRVHSCMKLARDTALDVTASQWQRLAAAQAMVACVDVGGLRALAKLVRAGPDRLSARLAPELAELLYPSYLTTSDVLDLIDRSVPAEPYSSEGFSNHLVTLHAAANGRSAQQQFAYGVAALFMGSPSSAEEAEAPRRHVELGHGLAALARAELALHPIGDVDDGLIRLLMATERVQGTYSAEDEYKLLATRVQEDRTLNRGLMWSDVQCSRIGKTSESLPSRIWQVGPHSGHKLWQISGADIDWLKEDALAMPNEFERRIAFSGVLAVLHSEGTVESCAAMLDELAARDSALQADLMEFRRPSRIDSHDAGGHAYIERAAKKTAAAKKSWIDFRDSLRANPEILDDPEAIKSWKAGLHRLHDLNRWLAMKVRHDQVDGLATLSVLEQGFGPVVAQHYAHAMSLTWRSVRPERPRKTGENTFSTRLVNTLAVDAVELESQAPGWVHRLSDAEAGLAVRHACLAGTIRKTWVDQLIDSRTNAALPEIARAVAAEYRSLGTYSNILVSAAYNDTRALLAIAAEIWSLLKRGEPADDATLERAIRILRRSLASLNPIVVRRLVLKRLSVHMASGNEARVFEYLGLLSDIDPDELASVTLTALVRWDGESEVEFSARVQRWLGQLFEGLGGGGIATASLARIPIPSLVCLLRLAYLHIRPEVLSDRRGASGRGQMEKAQSARSTIFNALAERPGPLAYAALVQLSSDPLFADIALRLREIAYARAETDGDLHPWSSAEVTNFERTHTLNRPGF